MFIVQATEVIENDTGNSEVVDRVEFSSKFLNCFSSDF
jgi:hypothetical protein